MHLMEKRPEDMNLKEIFIEMKNISELMVDLAYSSVLFDSEAIADEVNALEETMGELNHQLTIRALLASRTREEAEQISEILNVASAIKDISNHAQNISEIVSRDLDIHSVILESLKHTDEKIFRVQLEEQSPLIGVSLRESQLASHIGVTVIAVRRGKRWIYNPKKRFVFCDEDILIARGTEEGHLILKEIAKGRRSKW
ncbi:MAG: potassium channel protein [Theionarchaea archaeon]|nr:potassium channel protein [Theionarchaea archaeon]